VLTKAFKMLQYAKFLKKNQPTLTSMSSKKKFVPPEGVMKIDFNPHTWGLITDGVLPEAETSVLVTLNTGEEAKTNVYIEGAKLVEVNKDEHLSSLFRRKTEGGENYFDKAFDRIMVQMFIFNTFASKNWIIFGYVKASGGSKTIPILILYSERLGLPFTA
jgi:hypothetical protein